MDLSDVQAHLNDSYILFSSLIEILYLKIGMTGMYIKIIFNLSSIKYILL